VRLCDFGSAGETGSPYRSWLTVRNVGADAPQFFAPGRDERLRAELGRYAARYASLPGRAVTGNNPRRRALIELREQWPSFARHCAAARERISADPHSPGSRSLSALLARLERESDVLDPALPERLERELAQPDPEPLCVLAGCGVSELKPSPADIRQAPPPAPTEAFRQIRCRDYSHWLELTDAHNGRPGLLYVRIAVDARRAGRAPLTYGADGPVKVWVNGREVGCKPEATNPARPEEYRAEVDWLEGENTVVFALDTNNGDAWGVHVGVPLG